MVNALDIGFGIAGIMLVIHVVTYIMLRSNSTVRDFVSMVVPLAPAIDVLYQEDGSVIFEEKSEVRRLTGLAAFVTTLWSPVITAAFTGYGIYRLAYWVGYRFLIHRVLYRTLGYWTLYRGLFCLPVAAFFIGEDAMGKVMNEIMQKIHEIIALIKKAFRSRSKSGSDDGYPDDDYGYDNFEEVCEDDGCF